MGDRFEQKSLTFKASKLEVEINFKLQLSTVVEWYELHCKQLAHTYSTLWGKENETS